MHPPKLSSSETVRLQKFTDSTVVWSLEHKQLRIDVETAQDCDAEVPTPYNCVYSTL